MYGGKFNPVPLTPVVDVVIDLDGIVDVCVCAPDDFNNKFAAVADAKFS